MSRNLEWKNFMYFFNDCPTFSFALSLWLLCSTSYIFLYNNIENEREKSDRKIVDSTLWNRLKRMGCLKRMAITQSSFFFITVYQSIKTATEYRVQNKAIRFFLFVYVFVLFCCSHSTISYKHIKNIIWLISSYSQFKPLCLTLTLSICYTLFNIRAFQQMFCW